MAGCRAGGQAGSNSSRDVEQNKHLCQDERSLTLPMYAQQGSQILSKAPSLFWNMADTLLVYGSLDEAIGKQCECHRTQSQ